MDASSHFVDKLATLLHRVPQLADLVLEHLGVRLKVPILRLMVRSMQNEMCVMHKETNIRYARKVDVLID